MFIDKAIKDLESLKVIAAQGLHGKYVLALNLGIEALKRHQWNRTHSFIKISKLLPGETAKK